MADTVQNQAAAQPQQQQQQQGGGGIGAMFQTAIRLLSYWMIIQLALSFLFPTVKNTQQPAPLLDDGSDPSLNAIGRGLDDSKSALENRKEKQPPALPPVLLPHWREHTAGMLDVYLVEDRDDHDALRDPAVRAAATHVHGFEIRHSVTSPERSVNVTLNLTSCALRNCTLYTHVMLSNKRLFSATACLPFVRFSLHRKSKLRNLFDSDNEAEVEAEATTPERSKESKDSNTAAGAASDDEEAPTVIATIPPSISIDVVADWSRWESKNIPAPMQPFIKPLTGRNNVNPGPGGRKSNVGLLSSSDDDEQPRDIPYTVTLGPAQYPPILFLNEFWILDEYRNVFNASTAGAVNITVSTRPLAIFWFLMFATFDHQMASQKEWGLQTSRGIDDLKRMLLETEPWLLAVTVFVSLLHMLFEYLTFSSDVAFWKGRKNFRGLSLRSVALNCYFQTIIFLYLLDGNETSYSVLLPSGIGVLIEFWKLAKTVTVEAVAGSEGAPLWAVWRRFKVTEADSYDSKTKRFDQQAMRYLLMAMTPCLLAYTTYSAIYDQHKGWYSFFIRTQVRFIYWFGFVKMTPQIFINYQLKTVGHLPWKAFIYKFLNTFIDDLFAFVIKMPTMHRLAVFRDDIVWLILLYQRWIYPTDFSRSAEGDGDDETATTAAATADAAATTAAAALLPDAQKQAKKEGDDEAEEKEEKKKDDDKAQSASAARADDIDD